MSVGLIDVEDGGEPMDAASREGVGGRRLCPGCGSGEGAPRGGKSGFELLGCRACRTLYVAALPAAEAAENYEGYYDEGNLAERIDAYDKRRAAIHPYKPRDPARWGDVPFYGWSEDKARQYGVPQRPDFGAFVRKKGFGLD